MNACAVPDEHVFRLEAAEAPRRGEAEQRVNREALAGRAKVRGGSERVRTDQHALGRPPERDLAPAGEANDADDVERGGGEVRRDAVERHAEPRRESGTVPVMPVEELDDARRLAEIANSGIDAAGIERIDDPNPPVRPQGVRAPLDPARLEPAEAELELVAERGRHDRSIPRSLTGNLACGARRN